ncbi:uncharacterized protein LOC117789208 isoform X1 [Drosophila innubila]|uniref:uncharacterized protein LOC117789208 isoform X1 n=1 Tax=Drosophila innubila TaxID=198719 RepID=UPI00148BCA33|nr:uncharacterized protein LOC117789208 isoform X1 [Drosophila innubila]
MRKFLIFVALCAICHAAPATKDPIPTALDSKATHTQDHAGSHADKEQTVIHRQKRDEDAPVKPDSIKAREGLQHGHQQHAQAVPEILIAQDALPHDHKKTKRDTHDHDVGHDALSLPRDTPAKPDSVKAQEGLQHNYDHDHHAQVLGAPHDHKQTKRDTPAKPDAVKALEQLHHDRDLLANVSPVRSSGHDALTHDHKKTKREAPSKPDSIKAQEGLQHNPAHLSAVQPVTSFAHDVHDHKKTKRDTPAKPDAVKAQEGLQHNYDHDHHAQALPETLVTHDALPHDHKLYKRENVTPGSPTGSKDIEHEGSSTPHGPLRHRPVPVAELFNKAKPSSSSEESKESKETKETKE